MEYIVIFQMTWTWCIKNSCFVVFAKQTDTVFLQVSMPQESHLNNKRVFYLHGCRSSNYHKKCSGIRPFVIVSHRMQGLKPTKHKYGTVRDYCWWKLRTGRLRTCKRSWRESWVVWNRPFLACKVRKSFLCFTWENCPFFAPEWIAQSYLRLNLIWF